MEGGSKRVYRGCVADIYSAKWASIVRADSCGRVVDSTGDGISRLSGGIVFLQVSALKTHDVSDQQFPILCGHPDEAGMEAVGTAWDRKGVKPQHFDRGCEGSVVGQEECEGKDSPEFVGCRDRYTDTAATEVDGFFREVTFPVVRVELNAGG